MFIELTEIRLTHKRPIIVNFDTVCSISKNDDNTTKIEYLTGVSIDVCETYSEVRNIIVEHQVEGSKEL